jgi:hypothetical protein
MSFFFFFFGFFMSRIRDFNIMHLLLHRAASWFRLPWLFFPLEWNHSCHTRETVTGRSRSYSSIPLIVQLHLPQPIHDGQNTPTHLPCVLKLCT